MLCCMKLSTLASRFAVGGAILVAALLTACGSGGSSAAQTVRYVGLMHVGTDHIPPSLGALVTQLSDRFGWDISSLEVNRCVEKLQKSCDFKGKNIKVLWRNLEPDQADMQAQRFVKNHVDVIVAFEDTSIAAAEKATRKLRIPIVFLHPSDPVRDGLVKTLSHPGTNLTGVFGPRDVVAKQLELYELLVPKLHRVLTLVDPSDPRTDRLLADYKSAAERLPRPLQLDIRQATTAQDLRRVFGSLRPGEVDGAFLLSPSLRLTQSALTIRLAKKAGLPVQAHRKEWVQQGALFSYGADLTPIGRAGARYVDAILKDASPADLAIEEIPTVKFAINLKTASRLGIKVPQDLIIRADEVYR